jgi:hypothetical protein
MSPLFEPEGCALVRRNPWILGLALAPCMCLIALHLTVRGTPAWEGGLSAAWMAFLYTGAWMIPVWMALLYMAHWRPSVKPTRVRADARGLTIGERFVPSAAIRKGIVLPGERAQVRLDLRGFRLPIQLRVGNARDARVLLEALSLDEAHTVAEFQAESTLGNAILILLLLAFMAGSLLKANLGVFPLVVLSLWVALSRRAARVGVGADGITLGWLWRRRFLGFDTITSVDRHPPRHPGRAPRGAIRGTPRRAPDSGSARAPDRTGVGR